MKKKSIAYYNTHSKPLSLRDLPLQADCLLEDIFVCVEDAETFSDLTRYLRRVVAVPLHIEEQADKYIKYRVGFASSGKSDYLKSKVRI